MSFPFLLAVAVAQEPPAPMGDFFCVDGPIPPVSKTAFANNDPITAAQLLSVRLLNLHFQQEGQLAKAVSRLFLPTPLTLQ